MGQQGWQQHHGVHLVTMYPPGIGGRIRIYERLRPVLPASQVVARVLSDDPGYRVVRAGPAVPLLSSEGEHGAWVALDGARNGRHVRRVIAMIFGDEFVVAFDILETELDNWNELEAVAREMVVSYQLGLGTRHRRFMFTPPAGWAALARGLVAYFYSPGFPRDPRFIAVYPATPAGPITWDPLPPTLMDELAEGIVADRPVVPAPFEVASGRDVRHLLIAGTGLRSKLAVVRHVIAQYAEPYLYVARLDQPLESQGGEQVPENLARLARSIELVPPSETRAIARMTRVFDHWAD